MTAKTEALVTRFRAWSEALEKQIDYKCRPLTSNATPKRMREYRSRLHDGDNLKRLQRALNALADAHERGDVPALLSELKTKATIAPLVNKGTDSGGGYYDFIPSPHYRDKSPAGMALQSMVDNAPTETTAVKAERERLSKISQLEAQIQFTKIPGFFPTPAGLATRLVEMADIQPGDRVLEPSAGNGHIADAVETVIGNFYGPVGRSTTLDVIECNSTLCEILKLKGYNLVRTDFTVASFNNHYDRIVMNPPFENGQDIDHVLHAYEMLKPGGRLVAIMGAGAFFRSDRKATAFRNWLEDRSGEHEELPAGSFTGKGAFVQTGVSTHVVTIDKPEVRDNETTATAEVSA